MGKGWRWHCACSLSLPYTLPWGGVGSKGEEDVLLTCLSWLPLGAFLLVLRADLVQEPNFGISEELRTQRVVLSEWGRKKSRAPVSPEP